MVSNNSLQRKGRDGTEEQKAPALLETALQTRPDPHAGPFLRGLNHALLWGMSFSHWLPCKRLIRGKKKKREKEEHWLHSQHDDRAPSQSENCGAAASQVLRDNGKPDVFVLQQTTPRARGAAPIQAAPQGRGAAAHRRPALGAEPRRYSESDPAGWEGRRRKREEGKGRRAAPQPRSAHRRPPAPSLSPAASSSALSPLSPHGVPRSLPLLSPPAGRRQARHSPRPLLPSAVYRSGLPWPTGRRHLGPASPFPLPFTSRLSPGIHPP